MVKQRKSKQYALLAGDALILYASLALTLFLRYGKFTSDIWAAHLSPFTVIFALWMLIFYIAGFYEANELKNTADFSKKFSVALLVNFLLAISLFYFIPAFGITPKTNLFIFFVLFGSATYGWRTAYNNFLISALDRKRILIAGNDASAAELVKHIRKNPQLGFDIAYWIQEDLSDKNLRPLKEIVNSHGITTIVLTAHMKKSPEASRLIYQNLTSGVEVIDLASLYESALKKIPIEELEESWFLENLEKSHRINDAVKQPFEIIFAVLLATVFLPIAFVIAIIIKITSPGSAFFSQVRVGKNGNHFVLWKFRTMVKDAERNGPRWAKPNDARTTPFGRFLRRSHLDELPQLYNIMRGELSLVGPRPERPEFVASLREQIPFYELRHLVKPGLTGWAQINYRYGSSAKDAYEKLQYDIYYMKHRSLFLDLAIVSRTAKRFFIPA